MDYPYLPSVLSGRGLVRHEGKKKKKTALKGVVSGVFSGEEKGHRARNLSNEKVLTQNRNTEYPRCECMEIYLSL